MDTDGEQTPRTPFWIQSTTNVRRVDLYRRRASSLIFNSGVLIILLLFFAILSIFFIIPSLISFTSHFLKPNLVKKSWDSINLVLVLFALAFGFLSRNINNNNNDNSNSRFENGFNRNRSDLSSGAPVSSPMVSTPNHWYDFPEQPISGLRRHRSTSSYPDLRELAPPWNHRGESPWRFSDDTHLNNNRVVNYDRYYFRREYDVGVKDFDEVVDLVKEDSFAPPSQPTVVENESFSHSHSPPPEQPPSPPQQPQDVIRTYHSVGVDDGDKGESLEFDKVLLPEKEIESPENQDSEVKEDEIRKKGKRERRERRRARSSEPRKMVVESNDLAPEPLSPPPIAPGFQDSDRKSSKERKRTGANATKEFFTSFYQKKKKKRQRQRSVDNLDILLHHPQPPVKFQLPPQSPPPTPSPPPPPPSILNNLFTSKKDRRKKTSSSTPPVPPPPPPARAPKPAAARVPKPTTITRVSPFLTEKPRAPVKMRYFNNIEDSSSGGESPMRGIPPPPPMPPFKMPDWKFAVEGDYVRVQSTLSSGSLSPDGDEAQSPSSAVASPVFCPSPDVNTKADKFIERFRAGLKLEKINSFNQSQGNRMSNLGPGPGPSRSYRL